jgi:hypothetical protein
MSLKMDVGMIPRCIVSTLLGGILLGTLALPVEAEACPYSDAIAQGDAAFAERASRERMTEAIASYEAVVPSLETLPVQSQAFVLDRLTQLYYELTTFDPGNTQQDKDAFQKGKDYGFRSLRLCPGFAEWENVDFAKAVSFVSDPAALLWTAHSWGVLCSYNVIEGMFELWKVRTLYERCVAVDETYWGASAHHALGAVLIVTPTALGGDPEAGRAHLERAIALSPDHLQNRVVYAQYWGFTYDFFGNVNGIRDRGFIEQQLAIVLEDPVGDWPFWNREAKKEAEELLRKLREGSP